MPENRSQEESSINAFRLLGKPAELPGAVESAQAAQNFPQPEAQGFVPDIRMQIGAEPEDRNIMDLIRAMTGRASTSGLEKFSNGLQSYIQNRDSYKTEREMLERVKKSAKLSEKDEEKLSFLKNWEKENNPEKLQKKYDRMSEQMIGVVDDIFRISIDQKKNAYPYDHRTAELTVRTVIETSQALQEEEWAKDKEAEVWLQRMEKDASWMADLLQVTVAESAMAPYNFDVMLQIQTLKERYKATVTSENLQGLNASDVPGFEFDTAQKKEIKDKNIGLSIPDKYKQKDINLTKGEALGLRELGVKMRDESFSIRMKWAAVSQADFSSANPGEATFMGNNLKPEEISFYKQLSWVHKNGEGYILAPHMVSKDDEKKEISAKLEAMLVTNASERLDDIIRGNLGSHPNKDSAISDLVKAVKTEAAIRLSKWKTRGKDIVSNLAILTTKQGLYEDYALLHVYRYCWQFVWNTDASGKAISKKKVDTAGIYSYSGDAYSLYYLKRADQYDRLGNSRTQFILPSSKGGRLEVDLLPYDKMPHFDPAEICLDAENNKKPENVDRFLQEQWNLLFGDDANSKRAREALGYQDIQEDVAQKLQEWAVKWRTPFLSKYVEEGTNYEIVVPHLGPAGLDIANFLEAVTDGDVKLNKGGKSIWQELIEGKKLSEVNWQKLENLPFDRWFVDLDMASRYMKIFIEVFEKDKDPFYNLVTGSPATLGPKELAKRLRLSFRDSGEGMPEEYEVAFIPFFVTMACIAKYGLDSAEAWNLPADGKSKTTAVENFLLEMAEWQRAFRWLPSDRPDGSLLAYKTPRYKDGKEVKWNYGNTMALIAEFYIAVLLREKKSAAEESRLMTTKNYENTAKRVNSMRFMGTGSLKKKVDVDIIPKM